MKNIRGNFNIMSTEINTTVRISFHVSFLEKAIKYIQRLSFLYF